jgi:hypothetical protein
MYWASIRQMNRKAMRAIRKGARKISPQTHEKRTVPAIPQTRPTIKSPTMGMMGILQNIAGRLMPL